MSGVLDFSQYIGGPDQVQVEQIFPSNQRTVIYNFQQDITGWVFTADYQTLVVDTVQFNRTTGKPNFAKSSIIGSFPKVEVAGGLEPTVIDLLTGTVKVTFPSQMYSGGILPDARQNVPITIYSLTWTDDSTPVQTQSHRWCFVQCYEPDVPASDPVLELDYTPITLGVA